MNTIDITAELYSTSYIFFEKWEDEVFAKVAYYLISSVILS